MKKKYYNYGKFKRAGGFARDNFAPNPTEALNVFGIIGKVVGFIINYLLKPVIHIIVFMLTGLFYRKGIDSPYKGSLLYTLIFFAVVGLLAKIVSFAVGS